MRRRFFNKKNKENYLTITALIDSTVYFNEMTGSDILPYTILKYRINTGEWVDYNNGIGIDLKLGENVQFYGDYHYATVRYCCFNIIGKCSLSGNCMSIAYYNDFHKRNKVIGSAFMYLFENCDSIVSVSSDFLPATMLSANCYYQMFYNCTSLETAPELPATTLATGCYYNMFRGCSKLNYIKAMFTTTPSSSYTSYWVDGVASTGTFVKNKNATWNVTASYGNGYIGIPLGWTIIKE